MHLTLKEQQEELIRNAVKSNRTVTLKTWILSDYGEKLLHFIVSEILSKYSKQDLEDVIYTSAKELAVNAVKANLKRVIFSEYNLNPENDDDYAEGLHLLQENMHERNLHKFKKLLKEMNLPVNITFYYNSKVLFIKVKNHFRMLTREEMRVREKFRKAVAYSSLPEFYMEHGDFTEGAGLGLTMVGILLDENGMDRHSFTLYCKEGYDETAARLEIPLSEDYRIRRIRFEEKCKELGVSAEELRQRIHHGTAV